MCKFNLAVFCCFAILGSSLSLPQIRRRLPQTTTAVPEKINYEELLKDPGFGDFLKELNTRYQNAQQSTTTTTTTTTTESPEDYFPRLQTENVNNKPSNFFVPLNREVQTPTISRPKHITRVFPASRSTTTTTTTSTTPATVLTESRRIVTLNNVQSTVATPLLQSVRILNDKERADLDQQFREQAQSAKYKFASAIDDTISGQLHEREETRDGLKVRGKYSYSDGYYLRTVEYEADEKGYRVINESTVMIGNGPQQNLDGSAKVATYIDGNAVKYQITADDYRSAKHEQLFTGLAEAADQNAK